MARDVSKTLGESRATNPAAIKAVILYEDLAAGLHGKSSLDQLQYKLGSKLPFTFSLWRWDVLREPLLREQAVIETCSADIILLSGQGRSELLLEVHDWSRRWLDQKQNRPYAIGVLLNNNTAFTAANHPVLASISKVAREAHAHLFASFGTPGFPTFSIRVSPKINVLKPHVSLPKKVQATKGRHVSAFDVMREMELQPFPTVSISFQNIKNQEQL